MREEKKRVPAGGPRSRGRAACQACNTHAPHLLQNVLQQLNLVPVALLLLPLLLLHPRFACIGSSLKTPTAMRSLWLAVINLWLHTKPLYLIKGVSTPTFTRC